MEWDCALLCLRAKLFKAFSHLNNVIELPSQRERWTVGLIPPPLCRRWWLQYLDTHVVTHGHGIDSGHLVARYEVAKKLGREIKRDVTWNIGLGKCLERKQKNILYEAAHHAIAKTVQSPTCTRVCVCPCMRVSVPAFKRVYMCQWGHALYIISCSF